MLIRGFLAFFGLTLIIGVYANEGLTEESQKLRTKKAFNAFQVINFPNDVCAGDNRNGTCFTTDECSSKGGTSSGSCANGFGVCCLFTLKCGSTSSYNNTYLVQGSATSITSYPCEYTICSANPNVCRFRLDFTGFTIAGPVAGTASLTAAAANNRGGGTGNCVTDAFVVSSQGTRSTPVICGSNTGQHMFVDASSSGCITASFDISSSKSVTRSWDIKVTQYDCGNIKGGPPGCLQYFEGTINTVASFNFPLTSTTVSSTATHLANQNYDICFRRESGFCFLCLFPSITSAGTDKNAQTSFGLSISGDPTGAAAQGGFNTQCSTDYISIPFADSRPTTAAVFLQTSLPAVNRLCGRFLTNSAIGAASVSICTGISPFKLTFVTDGSEAGVTTGSASINSEEFATPSGTIGFSLLATQLACGTTA